MERQLQGKLGGVRDHRPVGGSHAWQDSQPAAGIENQGSWTLNFPLTTISYYFIFA
jgi:hypothetical protein